MVVAFGVFALKFDFNFFCFCLDNLKTFALVFSEHTVIVLWRVADIATACMFVFSVISL